MLSNSLYWLLLVTYFPNMDLSIIFPILRSRADWVVGIPVSLAILCFACVILRALFHEKERPGIENDLLAIISVFYKLNNN